MLDFQNRVSNIKLLKFYANRDNSTYLKKCDFKRSSFANSEIVIEFLASNESKSDL